MKPNVFIARPIPPEVEAYIAQHLDYSKWEQEAPIPRDQLLQRIAQADGLLTSGGKIDSELLDHAPQLKIVSNMSVGYNNFDLDAMKSRGVLGTNTPGVLDETVADLIFSLILGTARRVGELDQYVKQGKWSRGDNENLFGLDVHHRTLGIIGMGNIGEAVARRGKFGFGMNIKYHNRHRKPEAEQALEAEYTSLEELLRSSDFILLMTPLTPETHRYIGEEQFKMMKPTAVFVNASRGQTVDEEALLSALQNNTIFGAGLDVFEREPIDSTHKLLSLPNVITLPHIGSATAQTRFDMAMLAATNLVNALLGQEVPNVVMELRN